MGIVSTMYPRALDAALTAGDGIRSAFTAVQEAVGHTPRTLGTEQFSSNPGPIMIIGGYMSSHDVYSTLARSLMAAGSEYAESVPLIRHGLADVMDNALAVNDHAQRIMAETGADNIHVIGHSMGGNIARAWGKIHGGIEHAETITTIGTPNNGVMGLFPGDRALGHVIARMLGLESAGQLIKGSALLNALNGGTPTPGDTRYLTVASPVGRGFWDLVVPTKSVPLPDAHNVTNVRLPIGDSNHLTQVMSSDRAVDAVVRHIDGR